VGIRPRKSRHYRNLGERGVLRQVDAKAHSARDDHDFLRFGIDPSEYDDRTFKAGGDGGFAQADYASTVHFYLDAATPGANTVGTSGYDYASAAAVPEPATLWTLAAGLGFLAWRRRGR